LTALAEQRGGLKAFFATPAGKGTLVALAIVTLTASFLYLGPFVAIPTFLLFGLAVPIYSGWKRPRALAAIGLVALLVAIPVASLIEVEMLRAPSGAASSSSGYPYGNGAPVVSNAVVSPFTGADGATYTFSATVTPANVPKNDSSPLWLDLFVSTCPGATGNSSPYCTSGYPFVARNFTFPANFTSPQTVTFDVQLNGTNLWWWQMAAAFRSPTTSTNLTWAFLDLSNGYGAVQGPVSGTFADTFGLVLIPISLAMLLYPGSVFFFALLVYTFFKSREARKRREAAAATMAPPGSGPGPAPLPVGTPSDPTGAGGATAPPPPERACPNCGAVVYPNETQCWKCGVALTGAPATPLKSSP
jgi:hypothetical protein